MVVSNRARVCMGRRRRTVLFVRHCRLVIIKEALLSFNFQVNL